MLHFLWSAASAGTTFEDWSDRLDARIVSIPDGGSGYSGVAVLDYDRDGDLDLYFANGRTVGAALLANDGLGSFVEVTEEAGAALTTNTRGVLAADLDGDGWTDLVLTGDLDAPMRTLRNVGGTFEDASLSSGLAGAARNNSAHAADFDGDGLVDVYIAAGSLPAQGFVNHLYRNDGGFTFTDVAEAAGVDTDDGGCAAGFLHLDDDDQVDLVVANCAELGAHLPFEIYRNAGDGTFEDAYVESRAWALGHWMGLAVLDLDRDGLLDFFVTNSGDERSLPHVLYRNVGGGELADVAPAAGVASGEFGWGTVAPDLDNDGWEDLYYVGKSQVGDLCASPGNVHYNRGDGTFEPAVVPVDLTERFTSGLAYGDFDLDGFQDLVTVATEVPPLGVEGWPILLRNVGTDHHWLGVRPVGLPPNTAGLGGRVYLQSAGGSQVRLLEAGSSYLSTNTPWPTFGLGADTEASVCVRWPSGALEAYGPFPADGYVDLVEGDGQPAETCVAPEGEAEPLPTRCGCASVGPTPAPWLLLLGLFAVRRRS